VRRRSLAFELFFGIVVVALLTSMSVGVFERQSLSAALDQAIHSAKFDRPEETISFVAAEHAVLRKIDDNVLRVFLLSVAVAALLSLVVSRRLSAPLETLGKVVDDLAEGDFTHRAPVQGPIEVARLSESFNRMADSIEESEYLRRQLVDDLAHELRNPLAAARAQAEAMIDGVLPADNARLESLLDDMQHITSLIDDVQELAVAESGRLTYHMAPVDISELVRRQVKRAGSRVQPGVALGVRGDSQPAMVEGDALRLAQVLRNLLANAKVHTSQGSITFSIEQAPGTVSVSVIDTGVGIDPEALPHIFERFYRADKSRSTDTGGAGLGLAISRAIIRDHGGEMFASSTPGRGATVGFSIPRSQQPVAGDVPQH
jgi:two-component system sensor histidine kinase BaeS